MPRRLNENMRLAEARRRFLDRMERQGAAVESVRSAEYMLTRLSQSVRSTREPDPYVHTLTPADMDNFAYGPGGLIEGRRGRRVGASYFNRGRSVIRTFFEYCALMGWVNDNPARNLPRLKADAKTPPLMLNAVELAALMEATVTPIERIACAIGMNTGLRANDVSHLTVFDANLVSGELQTEIRKTNDLDAKPITAELHTELARWLTTYADVMEVNELPNDWFLVPSYHWDGLPLARSNFMPRPTTRMSRLHRVVQRPLRRLGYPTAGAGFHTLRRSSARALFELLREERGYGRDHALLVVQTYLNHASAEQTQVYIGLEPERDVRDRLLKGKSFLGKLAAEQSPAVAPVVPLTQGEMQRAN